LARSAIIETLYLISVNLAEPLTGVEIPPAGSRLVVLQGALEELISKLFGSRILAFDKKADVAYAGIVSRGRSNGQAICWSSHLPVKPSALPTDKLPPPRSHTDTPSPPVTRRLLSRQVSWSSILGL